MGIIISHYKDPYSPTRIQWNVNRVFIAAHMLVVFVNDCSFVSVHFRISGWVLNEMG